MKSKETKIKTILTQAEFKIETQNVVVESNLNQCKWVRTCQCHNLVQNTSFVI